MMMYRFGLRSLFYDDTKRTGRHGIRYKQVVFQYTGLASTGVGKEF